MFDCFPLAGTLSCMGGRVCVCVFGQGERRRLCDICGRDQSVSYHQNGFHATFQEILSRNK